MPSESILLVRLSALGDVIHALHGLVALRAARPRARIGFLVEDRSASLLAHQPDLDLLHVFPRKRWQLRMRRHPAAVGTEAHRFLSELRSARYDTVVDLQGNLKGGLLSSLTGARRRIGLAREDGIEGNHRFHTEWVALPEGPVHRVDRVFALLAPLGVEPAAGVPRVGVPPEDRDRADEILAELSLTPGGFAVLHPGTSAFGLYKRWPPDRFGRFAALLEERTGLPSLVTWGPGEEVLAEAVAAAGGGAAIPSPPTPGLPALARIVERSGLCVAGDTGVLHLAAFLGVPTVGIYGPKDPKVYGPRGPRATFFTKGLDCSGCPKRTCSDPVCMTSITPEEVLLIALPMLTGVASPAVAGAERGE